MVDVLITPASGTIKMDDATSVTPDGRTPGADKLWASGTSLYWGATKLDGGGGGGGGGTIGGSIAEDRIAVGASTANTIAGSSNFEWDDATLKMTNTGDTAITLLGDANRSGENSHAMAMRGKWNGTVIGTVMIMSGPDTTNKDDGQVAIYTAAGGTQAERMRIDETGNVGIGTSSPNSLLEIAGSNPKIIVDGGGSDDASIELRESASYGGRMYYDGDSSVFMKFTTIDGGTEKIRMAYDRDGNMYLGSADANDATSNPNMFIDENGRVGVGTTSPNSELDIRGASLLSGTTTVVGNATISGTTAMKAASHTPLEVRGLTGYGGSIKFVRNDGSYGFHVGMVENSSRLDLTANNSTTEKIMSLTSDRKVGINTTGPNKTLDVKGDAIFEGDVTVSGSSDLFFGANGTEYITTNGTDDLRIHAGDTVLLDGDGKAMVRTPYFAFETSAAAEKLRVDCDNGRLGIMTNSPNQALDVKGNTVLGESASSTLLVSGTSTFENDMTLTSATTSKPVLTLENTNADDSAAFFIFNKNSASPADGDELGYIQFKGDDSAGNSDTFADIYASAGDVTTTTEDGEIVFRNRYNGTMGQSLKIGGHYNSAGWSVWAGKEGTSGFLGFANNTADNNYLKFGSYLTTGNYTTAGFSVGNNAAAGNQQIHMMAQDDITISAGYDGSTTDSGINFQTNNTAETTSTTRMRIDKDGKVGIGTTSPGYELTLSDKFMWDGNHFRANQTNGPSMRNETPSSTNPVWTFNNDVDTGMSRAAANELSLITQGAEAMRIDADGLIGINTGSPTDLLTIQGDTNASTQIGAYAYSATNDKTAKIFLNKSANSTAGSHTAVADDDVLGLLAFRGSDGDSFEIGAQIRGQATQDFAAGARGTDLIFSTVDNSTTALDDRMAITQAGKVGIGTTSPDGGWLHINSAGTDQTLKLESTDGNVDAVFKDNGGTGILRFLTNTFRFYTDGAYSVTPLTLQGANVGINTTGPNATLDVKGNTIAGGTLLVSGNTTLENNLLSVNKAIKQDIVANYTVSTDYSHYMVTGDGNDPGTGGTTVVTMPTGPQVGDEYWIISQTTGNPIHGVAGNVTIKAGTGGTINGVAHTSTINISHPNTGASFAYKIAHIICVDGDTWVMSVSDQCPT